MNDEQQFAPGWPGIAPRWTSSAKIGVGTALSDKSLVWFTLSHGIFNEIYWPRIDTACTRDMELIVTDARDFFSEEKRDTKSEMEWIEEGVPGFRFVNTCQAGRYRIEKEIVADPHRPAVLQQARFVAQENGKRQDFHLHVLLAPHLGNRGQGNTAWVADHNGTPLLLAQRDDFCLALACSVPWRKRSVGFVGKSDGWQDLFQHKVMTWKYTRAENGNVALTGEVDLEAGDGEFELALGFGHSPDDAATCAVASLADGFKAARQDYVHGWKTWLKTLKPLSAKSPAHRDLSAVTAAVLRTHESKAQPGGIIASLSIPWGMAKGDDDLGGYHLIWPRDLVEVAGGFAALGAHEDVRRVLRYLEKTQAADGHWPQNMWVDGSPYWQGIQLDESAFPILLVDLALQEKSLTARQARETWPMVRKAALYLLSHGPVTAQDGWEEDPGYSPFTLAVTIAALLAAADRAEEHDEVDFARYLRETADVWDDSIERWTYVTGTDLAQRFGVEGYYVRIAPPDIGDGGSPTQGFVPIKNRPPGESYEPAGHIVSADALALVRFGLRRPDDPRILNTLKVLDGLLKVETPHGPSWHRYNNDGYGEHADGSPFEGTGIGRAWPLLTGERAHYELAAGHDEEARRLLKAMESFANEGGFLSEQIWETRDIPARELSLGKPSGSAMPLVWAHAEYIKLRRSLHAGRVFDMPQPTVSRYLSGKRAVAAHDIWRFSHRIRALPVGRKLRIELKSPATVRWSANGWKSTLETTTRDTGYGLHVADLPTTKVPKGSTVEYTFYWTESDKWEGRNFSVEVVTAIESKPMPIPLEQRGAA